MSTFFLFEDRLVMGKVCAPLGADPCLWKTIPKNYLTNCMWLCGMIFLQCSHLTGLRLGGMLHITNIHALFAWALPYHCYSQQPTHHAPLHPNMPTRNPPPSGNMHATHLLFALQVGILPLVELKVKVEISSPAAADHIWLMCTCAIPHRYSVIMQMCAGTWAPKHIQRRARTHICSQININIGRLC